MSDTVAAQRQALSVELEAMALAVRDVQIVDEDWFLFRIARSS